MVHTEENLPYIYLLSATWNFMQSGWKIVNQKFIWGAGLMMVFGDKHANELHLGEHMGRAGSLNPKNCGNRYLVGLGSLSPIFIEVQL